MIGGGLEDDTQDTIIIGKGVVESLQYDCPNTVASAICGSMSVVRSETLGTRNLLTAIRIVVKCLAIACLRQELSTAETSENVGVRHHVEATSDRSVAVTRPQRCACQLHGRGTGRASGINAEARTAELEVIVDPPLGYCLVD